MNRRYHYTGRLILIITALLVYLYMWRPVRTAVTDNLVYPALTSSRTYDNTAQYSVKKDGLAIWIKFEWNEDVKNIQYRPQAGFFFLISICTFIFVSASLRWYVLVILLHLLSGISTALLLVYSGGDQGWQTGFILVDLIGTYLVPVLTLSLAVLAVAAMNKR